MTEAARHLELVRETPASADWDFAESKAPSREWTWWLRDMQAAVGHIVSGRVYVIGGRPSTGKTAFVQSLFVNLEEQARPADRILTAWTERAPAAAFASIFSLNEGLDEDLVLRERWEELPEGSAQKLKDAMRDLRAKRQWYPVIKSPCPTARDIATALETHRPDIFLLDYIQKVRPFGKQTQFEAWAEAMTHCTEFASNGGTVFIGSQLHRKGDKAFDKYRPPFMEDFKGGGMIEEGANLALGLYRPLKPMTAKEEREVSTGRADLRDWQQPGVMAIKVLKHSFWGNAADRIVRARIDRARRITDYRAEPAAPSDPGDAWEPDADELDLPF